MFGDFTSEELLLETPSAECDTKILNAMEAALQEEEPKATVAVMPGFFTMLLQRVAVPMAIFALAVTVGIQISSNSIESETAVAKNEVPAVVTDSTDTSADSGRIFIEGGGEGVIPVTLEEK